MLLLEVGLMQHNKQLQKDGKGPVRNDKFYKYSPVVSSDVVPNDKFLTQTKFSETIEQIVKQSNGLVNYIEAIVTYCDENDIELETVNKLISKPLKEKIKYQAQTLNYIKKTSKGILPL
jgi:hypothetical protein